MALVSCVHCGNQISDRAAACPRCGKPADIVLAQLSKPPSSAMQGGLLTRLVRWCRRRPDAIGQAFYAMVAAPTLLYALFEPDDESAYFLTSLAILPGAVWAIGFGIWRTLPDASLSGKLKRLGWSCFFLFLVGIGIWLLANYRFAWYLLGIAAIGFVCYVAYLAWRVPQKRPTKISSWYWCGVYVGAILIGIVAMDAGSQAQRRAQQAGPPRENAPNSSSGEALAWRKVIEGALLLLGMSIIKKSSRAAVLDELRAEGRLPAVPSEPTAPSAVTASLNHTSSTSSQRLNNP